MGKKTGKETEKRKNRKSQIKKAIIYQLVEENNIVDLEENIEGDIKREKERCR